MPGKGPEINRMGVGRQMAAGAAWMVTMRVAIRLIGLISTIILARLLLPEDFGLVAMAMLFYGFIETFGDFGFDVVLIREQSAGRDFYDTAWTLSAIRGAMVACLILGGAAPIADLFGDPRLTGILLVLAGSAFLHGLVNIGIVDFRKNMDFAKDFRFMVTVKLVSFVVTITLALSLKTYWALVYGIASGTLAQLALSYVMHPFRPRLSVARWREIMRFSKWLLITNVIGYARKRGDNAILGKLGGASVLGVYAVAYEIATLATTELVAPIRRAVLPGYARLTADPDELRRSYTDGLALIVILALPLAAGIGAAADSIVTIFLGPNWVAAIPLIQILTVFGILQVCTANAIPMLNALGRPQLNTAVNLAGLAVGLPVMYWAATRAGAHGIALALCGTGALTTFLYMGLVSRLLGVPAARLGAGVWRTLVAGLGMILAVHMVTQSWPESPAMPMLILRFACEVGTGAASYIAIGLGLWQLCGRPHGAESQILAAIQAKIGLAPASA